MAPRDCASADGGAALDADRGATGRGELAEVDASGDWLQLQQEALLHALSEDGVCVLRGLYRPATLGKMNNAYMRAWAFTRQLMTNGAQQWERKRYSGMDTRPSALFGNALYERVPFMKLKDSGAVGAGRDQGNVIRTGRGRYDFGAGMAGTCLSSDEVLRPPPLAGALGALLGPGTDWICYPGGLPAEGACGAGRWHRDQTSLWEGLGLEDGALPPVYLTLVAALTAVGPGDGPTQFRLGSHRLGAEAAAAAPLAQAQLRPGDAVLFDGRVVHRGSARRAEAGARHLFYGVYHKFWYTDEDEALGNGYCTVEPVPPEEIRRIEEEDPWLRAAAGSPRKSGTRGLEAQWAEAATLMMASTGVGLLLGFVLGRFQGQAKLVF